jgi:hypothetical protein
MILRGHSELSLRLSVVSGDLSASTGLNGYTVTVSNMGIRRDMPICLTFLLLPSMVAL